jgi:hypothetical protein
MLPTRPLPSNASWVGQPCQGCLTGQGPGEKRTDEVVEQRIVDDGGPGDDTAANRDRCRDSAMNAAVVRPGAYVIGLPCPRPSNASVSSSSIDPCRHQ